MSTLIRINVTNNSPFLHTFFFFQQPSVYTGGSEVFSNSLLSTAILPAAQGGSVYTFLLNLQYYAGVQQRHGQLTIGQPSGYASAIQSIELTPATGAVNNCTTMINACSGAEAAGTGQWCAERRIPYYISDIQPHA